MSQGKRKYKLIELFFSKIRPLAPDSSPRAAAKTPEGERTASFAGPAATAPAGGWRDFFSNVDHGTTMGFAFKQGNVVSLPEATPPPPEDVLRVPLMVAGKAFGSVQAAREQAGLTAQEIEIVSAVAAQLAQHLVNLTLSKNDEIPTRETSD